ncbi:hypothetical protein SLEP1_g25971 [Rubroshorea leprosula]|uniref:Uncharacterized protein n=1 Tax=Rubroshorea leprosula TaxID=152421 RepID=A0AAV5JKT5_9ROSI|nr:hypothetical protein SLEP1_g25971 [Rubroshorea leprosula]
MSSEETVSDERVRGRFEEVEGRDLGVPQNILEREDEREECFNPEEEIASEVMGYETSLESRSGLAHLVENCGVPEHVLTVNLVNALANEHHESLRDRTQLRKENVELVKKNEEAEVKVAKLKAEMEELKKENATLKKDSELSYEKRKICEDELEKKEKELDEVAKAAVELELKVHNSVEEHVAGFLKSSTFEDIINLYQLPTAIEGEVEKNGESSTTDFRPKVSLKWDRDSRGQTILPPNFSFEFVPVADEGSEGVDNPDQPVE